MADWKQKLKKMKKYKIELTDDEFEWVLEATLNPTTLETEKEFEIREGLNFKLQKIKVL